MFKHSLFYKLLSSSLILGWLVSAPEEEQKDYMRPSYSYRFISRLMDVLLDILYRMGDTLRKLTQCSIAGQDLLGFIGILVFFYFTFDIALNDYSLRRTIIEVLIALAGLGMPFIRKAPGIWEGSLIIACFRWWETSD